MDTNDPFVWGCPVCGTKVLGTSEEAATHMFDCASTDMDEHYGGFVKYGVKQPFAEEFLWLSKGAPADDRPERFSDTAREGEYREY